MGIPFLVEIPLIMHFDMEPAVQKRHLAETVLQDRIIVHRGIGENFRIRPERDGRARLFGISDALKLLGRDTPLENDTIPRSIAAYVDFHTR